jgi:hypothetical protein
MNMPVLILDLEDIKVAMSDHNAEWLLDPATGQLCLDPEDAAFTFGREEVETWAPTDLEKVLPIPHFDSSDGYQLMQQFAVEEASSDATERLQEALRMRKPFRRFKDALSAFPDDQRRWFEFESEVMKRIVKDFYEAEGYAVHWAGSPSEPTGLS